MATFNQQNQSVTRQQNAETIYNNESEQVRALVSEVNALKQQLATIAPEALSYKAEVEEILERTEQQLNSTQPSKNKIIQYLQEAKAMVEGVDGLSASVVSAIASASALFL